MSNTESTALIIYLIISCVCLFFFIRFKLKQFKKKEPELLKAEMKKNSSRASLATQIKDILEIFIPFT